MRIVSLIILFLTTGSCSHYVYDAGVKKNENAFKRYLKTISNYENGKKEVLVTKYREAIFFLSFVTNIDSKADYSTTIGYKSKEDFLNDRRKWKKWFGKNKSKLTNKYIDSIYKSLRLTPPAILNIK